MSLIDQLKSALNETSSAGERAILFSPVDPERMRKKLKVEERGKEDGLANFPAQDASSLSATELSIHGEFTEIQQTYLREHEEQQQAYIKRFHAIVESWELDRIADEEKNLLGGLKVDDIANDADLYAKAEDLKAKSNELWSFRVRNSLTGRLPEKQKSAANSLSKLFTLFLIEVVASFFLVRETGDPIMIFLLAVAYCGINCGFPFFLGPSLAPAFDEGRDKAFDSRRIFSCAMLAACGLILLFINTGMGHYRAAAMELAQRAQSTATSNFEQLADLQRESLAIGQVALERTLSQGLLFPDLISFMLFMVGVFCGVLAAYEGISRADRFPGYTKLSRSFTEAYESYEDLLGDCADRIKSEREKASQKLKALKRALTASLEKAPAIIEASRGTTRKLEQALMVLSSRHHQLIGEYRAANAKARSEPSPAYFSSAPELPIPSFEPPDFGAIPRDRAAQVIGRIERALVDLHKQVDREIEKLPRTEDVITSYPLRIE